MAASFTVMHAAPGTPLRNVDAGSLADLLAEPGWVWIDVAGRDLGNLGSLPELLQLHPLDLEDIAAPAELPRFEHRDDYSFFIAHTPAETVDRLRTTEIDMVISDKMLATFHREATPGLGALRAHSYQEVFSTPGDVFALITDVMARRTLPLLEGLDSEIDTLEEMAIEGDPSVPLRVQGLRRDLLRLRNVVVRMRDALRSVLSDRAFPLTKGGRHRIVSAHDDYGRAVDSLETARLLLASVLDTYRATAAERMNDVMKVLTVFSAIVLPLSLMAGIYGMNFTNMPELSWERGYFILLGIMGVTGLGLWLYFARRGFIGGPKLPRVDRAVGRGLGAFVHLTQAPIRGLHRLVVTPQQQDGSWESDTDAGSDL